MISGIFELLLFSLPSLVYVRRQRRSGSTQRRALAAVGLQSGTPNWYLVGLALVVPITAVGALLWTRSRPVCCTEARAISSARRTPPAATSRWCCWRWPRRCCSAASSPGSWSGGWDSVAETRLRRWLRERSGSIGPGWLAHALINLLPALLFGV